MRTTSPERRAEIEEVREELRRLLPPGTTVYTILRHVSRSGMSRRVDVVIRTDEGLQNITWKTARAMPGAYRQGQDGALVVGGCGFDAGFDVVYGLGRTLHPEAFDCIGEKCPSNDHVNGDRDYSPHRHSDGGYALNHRWL